MSYKPKAGAQMAAPNVIPMADIMLVLLIIFMVVTPMLQKTHQVDLAPTNNPQDMKNADKDDAIVVAISRDGNIFLGDNEVTKEDLTGQVKDRISNRIDRTVYVKSDARAKYGRVALDINGAVNAVGDAVLDLTGEIFLFHLVVAQEDVAVARDGDHDGVIFVGVLHILWVIRGSQVHLMRLLQHGRDDHENNQQDEHDVGHGNDVGGRHLSAGFWLVRHDRLLLRAAAQDEVVDELHGGVVHLDVKGFHFVGEIVVSPDGGDSHEQAEGSGDERFGDTAGNGRETSGVAASDAPKGIQDADNGAEETDERSGRADSGEGREGHP